MPNKGSVNANKQQQQGDNENGVNGNVGNKFNPTQMQAQWPLMSTTLDVGKEVSLWAHWEVSV
jgi:hypothetical protein